MDPLELIAVFVWSFAVSFARGLLGHLPSGIDWGILGVGAAAAMPAANLGARFTGRLREETLLRVMVVVLVISGLAMLAQAAFG